VNRGGSGLLLIVVSRPCERSCEARESALENTLRYIIDIYAYEMNDLHFSDYMVRHHEVLEI
jgi:anion-transporting  ArsA/GET3 family ATPase